MRGDGKGEERGREGRGKRNRGGGEEGRGDGRGGGRGPQDFKLSALYRFLEGGITV